MVIKLEGEGVGNFVIIWTLLEELSLRLPSAIIKEHCLLDLVVQPSTVLINNHTHVKEGFKT